jgi:hypothetical protein
VFDCDILDGNHQIVKDNLGNNISGLAIWYKTCKIVPYASQHGAGNDTSKKYGTESHFLYHIKAISDGNDAPAT